MTTRPKLELTLNETARVKLLRDTCYEGRNATGVYHLYSVEHNGVEKAYFAEENVHQRILEANLRAGDEFVLRRVAAQNGKKISAQMIFETAQRVPESPPAILTGGDGTDRYRSIMEQCLREAVELTRTIQGVPWQNDDIRSISSCLFIARTRTNGYG